MLGILVLAFVVLPLVELYVIIQVGREIGAAATLALLVALALLGGFLVKRQGVGLARRVQAELEGGRMPADTVVDGFLVLLAGAFMLVPGFVTDAFGLVLLVPPVRALVRSLVLRRFRTRLAVVSVGVSGTRSSGTWSGSVPSAAWRVHDTEVVDAAVVDAEVVDADVVDAGPVHGDRTPGVPAGELGPRR